MESIREKLEIKTVELKHIKQFNKLLRYVFQITDSDIEESGYTDTLEIIKAKRPVLREADVFGWFHKDDLISQIALYPCKVNIHNQIFNMAGVTGVGTYPEYSGLGLMNDLIKLALKKMRKNKQYISYLYPYNIPYYKKRGWEIISDKMTYTIKDSQLPKMDKEKKGFVKRKEFDHGDVFKVYDAFARTNHGAMLRKQIHWEEYWRWENEDESVAAIYYNDNQDPTGLCFYKIKDDIFYIKEIIYLNQEARKGLWSFISAHFSMINLVKGFNYTNDPIFFLLEDGEIVETIQPNFMARIVDIKEFLKLFPFEETKYSFHFEVTDPLAEWNNDTFGIRFEDNEVKVSNEQIGEKIKTDIQTLTVLLMSYKRPSYLHKLERLQCNLEAVRILEDVIPDNQTYFSDYF